jgi:hypothetical protein
MCGWVLFETIFPFEAESVTQGAVHSTRDATAFRSTVSAGQSASVALLTALQDSNQRICWWTACLENRRRFLPCQGFVPAGSLLGNGIQCFFSDKLMSPTADDLTPLKDDMIAFIEGHGMRRFHGFVDYDEVQCIMWDMGSNPDGWKDFVELAKTAGAPFLTTHSWMLERTELDELVQRLTHSEFTDGDDVEDARWLRAYLGKLGYLQLGWAYQGSMFICEVSTEWYERYQRLLEVSDEFGGIPIDETDQEEES